MGDEHNTRNPMLLFLLRFAAPDPAPAVGTSYAVSFFDTADPDHTFVKYDVTPIQDSAADVTFIDAKVNHIARKVPTSHCKCGDPEGGTSDESGPTP